jgi:hypothetical protein
MPLLFAMAGLIAVGLSLACLVLPVLAVASLVRAVRAARHRRTATGRATPATCPSALDRELSDAAFIDVIRQEWPNEASVLRRPSM